MPRPVRFIVTSSNTPEAWTLGDLFRQRVQRSPDATAFLEKRSGTWQPTTWSDLHRRAVAVARGLAKVALRAGETVAILGPTSSAWCVYELGAQLVGAVTLGLYHDESVEGLRHLLDDGEARLLFVDGEDELRRALAALSGRSRQCHVVPWSDALYRKHSPAEPRLLSPELFRGQPEALADRDGRDPDQTALLIYTSGTTGPPKGAMLSHRNVIMLLSKQAELDPLYEDDVSMSFLPMAHVAERVISFYGRINAGFATAFASSASAVPDEIREVRPTIFPAVPRLLEKAHSRVAYEVGRQPAPIRVVLRWAEDIGRRRVRRLLAGERVPMTIGLGYWFADRLLFRRVREAFGGRVRLCIVGGAPSAREILEFFWAAGMPVYEVYGQTEATALTHVNLRAAVRLGTVGRPIAGLEHRLAPDGEILIRAPWIFKGYFRNPEATREAIVDGWLHTGDVGTVDADGYLQITDRKKDIIITAGGKNVSRATIEKAIKSQEPLISHVLVHGDRRPYISALIAPSPLETLEWGVEHNLVSPSELAKRTTELMAAPLRRSEALERAMACVAGHPDFVARVFEAVRRANGRLSKVEAVRRCLILDRDFSQERGELTPTLKIKRAAIEGAFAKQLASLYTENDRAAEV